MFDNILIQEINVVLYIMRYKRKIRNAKQHNKRIGIDKLLPVY